jgi:hypothetical protein
MNPTHGKVYLIQHYVITKVVFFNSFYLKINITKVVFFNSFYLKINITKVASGSQFIGGRNQITFLRKIFQVK